MTYPYHPQCGTPVVVFRKRTRGGQEQYDAMDVLGGSTGIPVWMTEARWKELRLAEHASVPLSVLQNLQALLASLRSGSKGPEGLSGEQNDEAKTTHAAAATEVTPRAGQAGIEGGAGATASPTVAGSTQA